MYLKFLKYCKVQAGAAKKKSDVEFIFKNPIVICILVFFFFHFKPNACIIMLEYVKNYGDSVARENIFALTPLLWLFLGPDQCSYNNLKNPVSFVIVTASHEHYPRRKPAPGKCAV